MNESKGSKTEYVWDYRNRLASVSEKNSSNVVLERTDYFYDGFNRLIRRTHDADGAGGGVAVDNFYIHEGSQIALQFDGASASDLTNRYLWGPAVDQILADEQVTSLGSAGNIIWPLTDPSCAKMKPRDLNSAAPPKG